MHMRPQKKWPQVSQELFVLWTCISERNIRAGHKYHFIGVSVEEEGAVVVLKMCYYSTYMRCYLLSCSMLYTK